MFQPEADQPLVEVKVSLFIIYLATPLLAIINLLVDKKNNEKKRNTLLVKSKLINGVESCGEFKKFIAG